MLDESPTLMLFAKRPRVGRVKTRLVPPLRAEQALALYRALLEDQLRFLRSFAAEARLELWLSGERDSDSAGDPRYGDIPRFEQSEGDLGRRLERAFARSRTPRPTGLAVIGSDAPTLPASTVRHAFVALREGTDAVVSPAEDGGYVLLGLRRPVAALFRDIPWGRPEVMRETRERARASGLNLVELPPWYDVDDPPALERLRRDLARPGGRDRAPATARWLATLDRSFPPVV